VDRAGSMESSASDDSGADKEEKITSDSAGEPKENRIPRIQQQALQARLFPSTRPGTADDDKTDVVRAVGGDNDSNDRYLCYRTELGSGAYKTVYKGMDKEEMVEIAWNEVLKSHKMTERERARIDKEVDILHDLDHESIVRFIGTWKDRNTGRRIFITELMTSGTLKEFLAETGIPKLKVIQGWCKQILTGLNYLHKRKIIHRDIKADNIFIDGTMGAVKIGDLGLATFTDNLPKNSVIGTPEFMAPEMYKEEYDTKVDVYAFGMTVLEMLTLEYPYSECTNAAQIYRKVSDGIKPACFGQLEDQNTIRRNFIMKCIAFDPDDRHDVPMLLQSPFFHGVAKKVKDTAFDRVESLIEVVSVHEDGTVDMVLTKVAKIDHEPEAPAESGSVEPEPKKKKAPKHLIEFQMKLSDYGDEGDDGDTPELLAQNMIEEGLIALEDRVELTSMIDNAMADARRQHQSSTEANDGADGLDLSRVSNATSDVGTFDDVETSSTGTVQEDGADRMAEVADAPAVDAAATADPAEPLDNEDAQSRQPREDIAGSPAVPEGAADPAADLRATFSMLDDGWWDAKDQFEKTNDFSGLCKYVQAKMNKHQTVLQAKQTESEQASSDYEAMTKKHAKLDHQHKELVRDHATMKATYAKDVKIVKNNESMRESMAKNLASFTLGTSSSKPAAFGATAAATLATPASASPNTARRASVPAAVPSLTSQGSVTSQGSAGGAPSNRVS